ncbi:hypothetical protein QJR30_06990 [Paraclostridium sordellii]|uniref:hypothetical protein n=1 Tax=Paraclostridium sordellii TaxID=1505 RepID=UPI0005E7AE4E|nr:hypothetical protein [Paeniclostridium sordellii]CEP80253.1 Uncharacterised protein [[Clostridium] sordellii] [Paeniclostridium sordellii]
MAQRRMFGKHKSETLITKYVELVYSLGFDIKEIRESYFNKMKGNSINPKFIES